MLTLCHRSIL